MLLYPDHTHPHTNYSVRGYREKIMSKLTQFTAAAALLLSTTAFTSTTANAQSYYSEAPSPHQQCLNGEKNRKVIGSLIGGTVGAFIGKEIAADNTRTEGAVLGAAIGGTAGYGIADKTVDCDPVYSSPAPRGYPQTQYHSTTYSQPSYRSGTYVSGNTYVSNHPVYQNASYGSHYSSGQTIQSSPHFSQMSQPRVIGSTYSSTYTQPVTYSRTYAPRRVTRTYSAAPRTHYHGSYACTGSH